jgi:branched-chain amino acid transport system permease protein
VSDAWSPRRLLANKGWLGIPVTALVCIVVPLNLFDLATQRQFVLIGIYTMVVIGLNLSFGYAGELAFGQVAMFATGAYVAGALSVHGHTDLVLALVMATLGAGVVGLISGLPGLRLNLWALAVTSFFLVLLLPQTITALEKWTGGPVGLLGITTPTLFGAPVTFEQLLILTVIVTFLWLAVARNLVRSRVGLAMQSLRESTALAEALGVSVYRLRVQAYIVGSLPAGAAGVFYCYLNSYISPEAFTLQLMIAFLAASVIGGSASIWGAPLGAAILVLGPEQSASFEKYSLVVFGLFLIIAGVVFSTGLVGVARSARAHLRIRSEKEAAPPEHHRADAAEVDRAPFAIRGELLSVTNVSKSFGGNRALSNVTLTARPGEVTAILGANGAGKTTLLNTVSGLLRVDSGEVRIGDAQLTGLPPHRVARAGVSRTFQTPIITRSATAREVVESGLLGSGPSGMLTAILRTPTFWRTRRDDNRRVDLALEACGIQHLANREATSLPLGTRRLLEVVRAIVSAPRLVMLDEPAAGLDDEGLDELATLVNLSRDAGATVVMVEHNIGFVLGLADRVHVMHLGEVIASGTPDEIRRNPAVISSYLGSASPVERPELEPALARGELDAQPGR